MIRRMLAIRQARRVRNARRRACLAALRTELRAAEPIRCPVCGKPAPTMPAWAPGTDGFRVRTLVCDDHITGQPTREAV